MHQDVVGAEFPYDFFSAVSGNVFCCLIPVRNPSFQISEVDAINKVVQDQFEEIVRFLESESGG